MSNIRTANKRHKRALNPTLVRDKPSEKTPVEKAEPVKVEG
jgi:hypothetical protein